MLTKCTQRNKKCINTWQIYKTKVEVLHVDQACNLLLILRGAIVNRTSGTHKNLYIFTYFYKQYLVIFTTVWSPVIVKQLRRFQGTKPNKSKTIKSKKCTVCLTHRVRLCCYSSWGLQTQLRAEGKIKVHINKSKRHSKQK